MKDITVDFEEFWNGYPRKVGKQKAEIAWTKLRLAERIQAIKDSRDRQDRDRSWVNVTFIPYPATYMNQKMFNDSLDIGPKVVHPAHQEFQKPDPIKVVSREEGLAAMEEIFKIIGRPTGANR